MLGSLPGPPVGHQGGKSKYNLNVLKSWKSNQSLFAWCSFSAVLLSNFTTCSVNFYEERLAKEVNTFFNVPLPAVPSVLL